MRFSLITLLLFVLWIALGMTIWFLREPWQLRRMEDRDASIPMLRMQFSPDGSRELKSSRGGPVIVLQVLPGVESDEMMCLAYEKYFLHVFRAFELPENYRFIDNDTLEFECPKPPSQTNDDPYVRVTFHRRFPEWWWGHFYRVEVWLFTLVTVVLVFRGYNFLQNRRPAVSSPLQIAGALNCVSRS